MTTDSDKIAAFKTRLATNPKWAIRGLLAIYANQTHDEQAQEATNKLNGIGFTGTDAKLLSSFAKQVQKKIAWVESKGWNIQYEKMLSQKQFTILFKKMPKYARQLLGVAKQNEAPVEEQEVDVEMLEIAPEIEEATDQGKEQDMEDQKWEEDIDKANAAYRAGRYGYQFDCEDNPILQDYYESGVDDRHEIENH